jgi:uncharacterized protein (TIGR03067 family)
MKLLVPGILIVGLLSAADTKEDAVKKELKKLKGSWSATALEFAGQKAPADEAKKNKIMFDGDKVTFIEGDEKKQGTFKIDPTKKPATIDLIGTEGKEKGKTTKGIYALEGDSLKIAIGFKRDERPTEFATSKDVLVILFVLKRDKKQRACGSGFLWPEKFRFCSRFF